MLRRLSSIIGFAALGLVTLAAPALASETRVEDFSLV